MKFENFLNIRKIQKKETESASECTITETTKLSFFNGLLEFASRYHHRARSVPIELHAPRMSSQRNRYRTKHLSIRMLQNHHPSLYMCTSQLINIQKQSSGHTRAQDIWA